MCKSFCMSFKKKSDSTFQIKYLNSLQCSSNHSPRKKLWIIWKLLISALTHENFNNAKKNLKIWEKGALIVAWKVGTTILNLRKIGSEVMLKACCRKGAREMVLSWCIKVSGGTRALMCWLSVCWLVYSLESRKEQNPKLCIIDLLRSYNVWLMEKWTAFPNHDALDWDSDSIQYQDAKPA